MCFFKATLFNLPLPLRFKTVAIMKDINRTIEVLLLCHWTQGYRKTFQKVLFPMVWQCDDNGNSRVSARAGKQLVHDRLVNRYPTKEEARTVLMQRLCPLLIGFYPGHLIIAYRNTHVPTYFPIIITISQSYFNCIIRF